MDHLYKPTSFDNELGAELARFCESIPRDNLGRRPYVEVNQIVPGVRIRRLSHYTEAQAEIIRKAADAIFEQLQKKHLGEPEHRRESVEVLTLLPGAVVLREEIQTQPEETISEIEDHDSQDSNLPD